MILFNNYDNFIMVKVMKKEKISTIILIILTIGIFYVLVKDNYRDIFYSIINANYFYLLIAVIFYVLYTVLQAIPFYTFTKMNKYNLKFSFFIYLVAVTNFFNGITPLATGGQPLQVYELHKNKVSVVNSTNIVIENYIIFQFSIVLFGIISLIINNIFHLFAVNSILTNLTIIGFILNLSIFIFVLLVAFNKTLILNIINIIIKFLSKIKLVKNEKKHIKKWTKNCEEFNENFKLLFKNKKILLLNTLVFIVAFFFYFSIPLFIIYSLKITSNINLITTILLSSYIFLASSYLPIPGASGGIEYAFIEYFKNYIIGFKLKSLLLVWRFITYYLPVIVGGILFNLKRIKNKRII